MPLKTRITLLVVLAVAALWLLFAAVLWQRNQELTRRHHDTLLQAQRIAWTKLQSDAAAALGEAGARALASPGWQAGWSRSDRSGLGALLEPALRDRGRWRTDLFDERRSLVYSSSTAVRQDPLIDAGWVARALAGSETIAGLTQVSRDRYYWVVARRFGEPGAQGVLAIGLDASALLPELSKALGGESYLLNLRGRQVAGTASLPLAHGVDFGLRQPLATELDASGTRRMLAILQPLAGHDARQVGALLTLHDVTAQRAADRRMNALVGVGALLFLAAVGFAVFAYLRHALRPLERSVRVLGTLAQGNLDPGLDEADEAQRDEAGAIARGVAALRQEMLNLQMLRDERTRIRQQQERLIRRQLKALAESLDEDSRAEILEALEPEMRTSVLRQSGNELAELASILGRMSGLVTTQQNRLVGLLKELRAAMEHQAALASLRQELEIARNMQLSILPRAAPATDAVQVAALMIPAKEIGGDFYDYFFVDDTHLALVVADVSGKGVPAAFFMAISRTLLKTNALFLRRPGEAIARLNDQLCAENEQMMFVTVFFGVLDLASGALVYVNAGHNPPIVRTAAGATQFLPKGRNTALAVMDGLPYAEGECRLQPGDTLLLYTDGVTEATNAQGGLFGEAALDAVLRDADRPTADWPPAVLQAVRAFEAGAAQADDITCVAVRYRGAA
jgi:phosphoserine phosphatase RsbU/P